MKTKMPKGLIVLAIILILSSASTIRIFFRSDSHMIFLGQVLSGLPFKAYYTGLSIIDLIIAVGLLYRCRWSYVGFFVSTAWCAFIGIVNIFVTTNDTLIQSGWKLANSLSSFRTVQIIGVVLLAMMALWLFCYRRQFTAGNNKEGC